MRRVQAMRVDPRPLPTTLAAFAGRTIQGGANLQPGCKVLGGGETLDVESYFTDCGQCGFWADTIDSGQVDSRKPPQSRAQFLIALSFDVLLFVGIGMYRHRLLLTLGRAQLFQTLDDLLLINLHHLLQIRIVLQMHLEIEQMLGHPSALQVLGNLCLALFTATISQLGPTVRDLVLPPRWLGE